MISACPAAFDRRPRVRKASRFPRRAASRQTAFLVVSRILERSDHFALATDDCHSGPITGDRIPALADGVCNLRVAHGAAQRSTAPLQPGQRGPPKRIGCLTAVGHVGLGRVSNRSYEGLVRIARVWRTPMRSCVFLAGLSKTAAPRHVSIAVLSKTAVPRHVSIAGLSKTAECYSFFDSPAFKTAHRHSRLDSSAIETCLLEALSDSWSFKTALGRQF
jgi:hypothetical protein